MSTEQMRAEITKTYQGADWVEKVKKMTDQQVIAVYYRLLDQGRLK